MAVAPNFVCNSTEANFYLYDYLNKVFNSELIDGVDSIGNLFIYNARFGREVIELKTGLDINMVVSYKIKGSFLKN